MSVIRGFAFPISRTTIGNRRWESSSKRWGVIFGGHDGHAIDLPLNHAADTNLHAVGVVVGVGDDHFITMMDGRELKAL
jgi:hypothetical protein